MITPEEFDHIQILLGRDGNHVIKSMNFPTLVLSNAAIVEVQSRHQKT